MTAFILASASPARLATLRSAGFTPQVLVSDVDEDAVLAELVTAGASPAQKVKALARAKAREVAQRLTETGDDEAADELLVLGCDSMLEMRLDAGSAPVVVGKPRTPEVARERWRAMRGTSGTLHTGHWLIRTNPDDADALTEAGGTSSTIVHFADLSNAEIDAYIATGEPLKVAGGFTIDGLGGQFIRGIEGDHHGVVGVSLPLLRELAAEVGVQLTDLWAPGTPG